jgi:SAM-dependent methyltransferase
MKRGLVMNYDKLKEQWKIDEEKSFKGWDFSYLDNRWEEEKLPWDYEEILKGYLKPHYNLLDMGTGGGEFLLSLKHPYKNTSITESWKPNIELCKEKLKPLGITVKEVIDDDNLPFEDNTFDIVINKHASYSMKEVKRILKPNGMFITQQVGERNNEILSNRLIKDFNRQYENFNLNYILNEFSINDFKVLYENEYFPYLHFYDVGAIIYFAKIIQWEFPGFTVDNAFNELCKMYEELKSKPYIESCEHRFIAVGKNLK